MGWHTLMEFTPSLLGCVIAESNFSFELIRTRREFVINPPTTALTDVVVGIGNTSGAEIDKFEDFRLTAEPAARVKAPLTSECHANFECRFVPRAEFRRGSVADGAKSGLMARIIVLSVQHECLRAASPSPPRGYRATG
jgi:flavin reductase (DIM6/NTAB) family NADH-FMN oxidoreductase RutF